MRLFTFGCSFTKYCWPTWADIIAHDLQCPYENWAVSAIGNIAIQHKLLECDLKKHFTKKDLILVAWTGWSREDRYYGDWKPTGNVLTSPHYKKSFRKNFWHPQNDIVKNMTAIIVSNRCFDITYQSHIFDYKQFLNEKQLKNNNLEKFDYLYNSMPPKHLFSRDSNTKFNGLLKDEHPDIICHLNYAQQVYNKIGMKLKPSTINYYNDAFDYFVQKLEKQKRLPVLHRATERVMNKITEEWINENRKSK